MTTALCPRCNKEGADLRHMLWDCPKLLTYWGEVIALVGDITERNVELAPGPCLLHWFPHTSKTKITSKFLDLGLVLAKREITAH